MDQAGYLAGPVADFRDWLAERLRGAPIGFAVPGEIAYPDLSSALAAYNWPLARKTGLPNPHRGLPHVHPVVPMLIAHSPLAANAVVLNIIGNALRTAFAAVPASPHELSGAVASVLHWGGVYTEPRPGRGNRGWLKANHVHLLAILQAVVLDYAEGQDTSTVAGLRFNSGMTKVYSLLIDDFIIYDSRVSAALAWLAMRWWTIDGGQPAAMLPPLLKFACPRANGQMAPYRNPCRALFRNLTAHPYEHYMWNVRANWLLSEVLQVAAGVGAFSSLRHVEAALFQMGNRVI